MEAKGKLKQWQRGDLVIPESAPKTHAMLMKVLEVKGNQARTTYLDPWIQHKASTGRAPGSLNDGWHPLKMLQDPALFLKTEEFLQTFREHSFRREFPRGDR